jgi:hypothetical protein
MRYVRGYPEELPALAELLPEIARRVTIINGRHVDEVVGIVGYDTIGCASPVHHRHGIWRCFAAVSSGTEPHG